MDCCCQRKVLKAPLLLSCSQCWIRSVAALVYNITQIQGYQTNGVWFNQEAKTDTSTNSNETYHASHALSLYEYMKLMSRINFLTIDHRRWDSCDRFTK